MWFAVVLYSQEGAGKNILIDAFSKILGASLVTETANPSQTLFSRFSNGRLNKLLINVAVGVMSCLSVLLKR